jgi:hypothetical protein
MVAGLGGDIVTNTQSYPLIQALHAYANFCAKHGDAYVLRADVAWTLRTLLTGDPNTIADAAVTTNAPVRLRSDDHVMQAKRRLYGHIIANAHRLDVPFSNAPDQSPWSQIKRAMTALDEALQAVTK